MIAIIVLIGIAFYFFIGGAFCFYLTDREKDDNVYIAIVIWPLLFFIGLGYDFAMFLKKRFKK